MFDSFFILFLYRNVIGGVAGLTADANSLVNFARTAAQQHLLQYNEDIPVELLAQRLCDMKQGYTQFGGIQNFSLMIMETDHRFFLSLIFRSTAIRCIVALCGIRSSL